MRIKLLIVFLLLCLIGRTQPNYSKFYGGYHWNDRGAFSGGLHIPAAGTPALYTGQWIRSGAIIYDSTGGNKGVHVWNGSTWVRMVDTTMTNFLASSLTASNGITRLVNDFRLGGTMNTGATIIDANNAATLFWTNFNDYYVTINSGAGREFVVSKGINRLVVDDNNTRVNSPTNVSQLNMTDGQAYMTTNSQLYLNGQHSWIGAVDSMIMGIGGSYPAGASGIYGYPTHLKIFAAGYQDQYAPDSVVWRTTDRHSSLTLNTSGWHAWEDDGDFWFYNLERITDTTGHDVLVQTRSGEKMKRIAAGLVGGGGGGSTPTLQQVYAQSNFLPSLNHSSYLDITNKNYIIGGSNAVLRINDSTGAVDVIGTRTFIGGNSPTTTDGIWLEPNALTGTSTSLNILGVSTEAPKNGRVENITVGSGLNLSSSNVLTATGGGGTPGGSDTYVQFNDGGAFGGDAGMVFNKTSNELTVAGQSFFGAGLSVSGAYSTNAGMNLSYIPASNVGRIVMYDGGYKNFEAIAQEVFLYGGGSSPGVMVTGAGLVGIGTATAADVTSNLTIKGSFSTPYAAKTTTYPITATDHTLEATSGTFTMTLPTAVGITGRQYVITNSGSGVITLATTSSQTFVNVTATPTTLTLNQFNTVIVVSNGANWLRISSL